MSKLDDKKKLKKIDPAVKAMPKKDNVAKSSVASAKRKPAAKLKKHIADEMKILPTKRVWPD